MIMAETTGDLAWHALGQATRDHELAFVMDQVVQLAQHGALAGVSELVTERLRQVDLHGYTIAHDAARWGNGWLVMAALLRVTRTYADILEGGGDFSDAEEACREAGALLAAELDRLNVLMTPETPATVTT
jgi:hypothetical protein